MKLKFMRLDWLLNRHYCHFPCVSRHRLPHVVSILCVFVAASTVVGNHGAIDYVAQTFVHVACDFVGWPDE